MKVLEPPVARSMSKDLQPPPPAETLTRVNPLAAALTGAAAIGGVAEVLLERVAGPILTHAAGPSLAPVAAMASRLGTLVVAVTAVLVLLAAVAWAGVAWERHRIVGAAILTAAVTALAAGVFGGSGTLTLLHLSVAIAATGTVLVVRLPGIYGIAIAAVAVAIVAGQWSLGYPGNQYTVAARVIAETALVVALLFFAASVAGWSRRRSVIGLGAGAIFAAAALVSDRTPLVALWASGATLWMPSLVYIGAGAAVGLLLANWLPHRSTRHLAAGLALLAVAGIEPTLVHHNVTALVAVLALAAPTARTSP
jgi:hypothetical protein